MVKKDLLKVRSEVKKRKPTYTRQQTNQYAKFKNNDAWRKPKGYQSKIRLHRKGHKTMPEVGYGSPKSVRGLNKHGMLEVLVHNTSDLAKVDVKTQVAVIGGKVGSRKKLAILEAAKASKVKIANFKDVDVKIKALTKEPRVKKESKASVKKAPAKKEKASEKQEVAEE